VRVSGRCLRTRQQLRTQSDGQAVLKAFGATQVTATTNTRSTGGGGVARGWPGGGHPRPRSKHVSAARRTDTSEGRCVGRRVGAPVLKGGGGAHSASRSRLGPDHHYVDLLKRCKKNFPFTRPTASRERLISCYIIEIMLNPFTRSTHRVCASRERSYFLLVFICVHTSVVHLVNGLISCYVVVC
jgi:hypothetical protein